MRQSVRRGPSRRVWVVVAGAAVAAGLFAATVLANAGADLW